MSGQQVMTTAMRGLLRRSSGVRRLSTLPPLTDPHALLHKTRIPTYHFQDSLPKLPLPALEDTLMRLLYAAEPLCTH